MNSWLRSLAGVVAAGGALLVFAEIILRADPLTVEITPRPDRAAVELRLHGNAPAETPVEARLQRSSDLKNWQAVGTKVRLPALEAGNGAKLSEEASPLGFYRLIARDTTFTESGGAGVLGYSSAFADEIDALGNYGLEDFTERFRFREQYLPGISWNPTNSLYWDAFKKETTKPGTMPPLTSFVLPALKLSDSELFRFQANGFVVSERLGNNSYADAYYDVFTRDLPVFVTTDSILHAWHRSSDAVLLVVEEGHLRAQLRRLLLAMLSQVAAAREDYGSGVLKDSLDDSEYFLAVAAHLISINSELTNSLPPPTPRVLESLEKIRAAVPALYTFFDGKQGAEIVVFSQYIPRSHYARRASLQRYFQAMMWLGRVDLRVAGNPEYASLRQLGSAIVLNDLLHRSQRRATWQMIDHFLTTSCRSTGFDELRPA